MKLAEAPCVSQRESPPDILDACGCLRTACDQLKAGSTVNHMRKSSSIPRPQLPSTELPRCPKCGEEMWLARVQAIEPGYNSNIFECPSCSERVIMFGEYAKSTGCSLLLMGVSFGLRSANSDVLDEEPAFIHLSLSSDIGCQIGGLASRQIHIRHPGMWAQ